jgi:cysteine desulfurase
VIYFDHNATTPLSPEARAAWLETSGKFPGNPSSLHRIGSRADRALSEARESLSAILSCEAHEIIWTSGATESANTVFHHVSRLNTNAPVWISAIEHPCVLRAASYWLGERVRLIPASRNGAVDLNWILTRLPREKPALISVMAANNETGVLQPWREIQDLCESAGIPYFCDAVQWLGKMPAQGLGKISFLSGCAHKLGGPRGIGFLKAPAGNSFHPLITGGGQEEGRRGGTENVAGAMAFIAALKSREEKLGAESTSNREVWRKQFEKQLLQALPGVEIVAESSPRLWNTVSALMPRTECPQRWVVKLDRLGFAVSTGSACASGSEEPSHVLLAMGVEPSDTGRVLRFSSGLETQMEDWDQLLSALGEVFRLLK